jgi:hypothetical protein
MNISDVVKVTVSNANLQAAPGRTTWMISSPAIGTLLSTNSPIYQTVTSQAALVSLLSTVTTSTAAANSVEAIAAGVYFSAPQGPGALGFGLQTNGDGSPAVAAANITNVANTSEVNIGICSVNTGDILGTATWCQNNNFGFIARTADANHLNLPIGSQTNSLGVLLSSANTPNTMLIYNANAATSPTNSAITDGYPDWAALGIAASNTPGSYAMWGQELPGQVAAPLSETQSVNAHAANCNTYEIPRNYNSPGLWLGMATGPLTAGSGLYTWWDNGDFARFAKAQSESTVLNALLSSGQKLPNDQRGRGIVYQALLKLWNSFTNPPYEAIGPDTYSDPLDLNTQNGGFVITMPNFNLATAADLATRSLGSPVGSVPASTTNPPINITYWPAGALQSVSIKLFNAL